MRGDGGRGRGVWRKLGTGVKVNDLGALQSRTERCLVK